MKKNSIVIAFILLLTSLANAQEVETFEDHGDHPVPISVIAGHKASMYQML